MRALAIAAIAMLTVAFICCGPEADDGQWERNRWIRRCAERRPLAECIADRAELERRGMVPR